MGKIVKYCAACEESFAEKFGFCPNCGQVMTAFEMNPVTQQAQIPEEPAPIVALNEPEPIVEADEPAFQTPEPIFKTSEPTLFQKVPEIETAPAVETAAVSVNQTQGFSDAVKAAIIEDDADDEPEITPTETKTFAAAAGANGNGNFQTANYNYQDISDIKPVQADDGYRITVIEEKNGKQRNLLLLGSLALMLTLALGGTVYSLFSKDLLVGAINEEGGIFVPIVDEDPVPVEEQPKPKTEKDAGGGGGGGREEKEKASDGRLVNQSEKPISPPNAKVPQLTNPALPVFMETQGNIKRPITEKPPGLPGSDNLNPSNGTGRGGGLGGGNGTGLGNGNGTGEGNGNGSGSGNGNGNGNGNGKGDGTEGNNPPPPPPKPVEVVSVPFRIISKPRPGYTDAARQNQVTGVVRLRVTFSASGAVGSISPVSGLPYGLTEQAIAAARQIKFEPAKKNGVAIPSTKIIEYSFSIY